MITNENDHKLTDKNAAASNIPGVFDLPLLIQQISELGKLDAPRLEFLFETSKIFLKFLKCDRVELWLKEHQRCSRYITENKKDGSLNHRVTPCLLEPDENTEIEPEKVPDFEKLGMEVFSEKLDGHLPFVSKKGNLVTGDMAESLKTWKRQAGIRRWAEVVYREKYRSVVIVRLTCLADKLGLLVFKSAPLDFFPRKNIEQYEEIGREFGFALFNNQTKIDLRERNKELSCMYRIAHLATMPRMSLDKVLQKIVELLPPAWQYPEIAAARIVFDGVEYTSPGFKNVRIKQAADITVGGKKQGRVEVVYLGEAPHWEEGPFLKEERSLINTVASEISLIITKKQSEDERARLHSQLMHADRLATLGQVTAGVAHELNEPLGNILGFAQLALKSPDIPEQSVNDLEKIIAASLHTREVIKKLLLFARQAPSRKEPVQLNEIVTNGLYFLESRCSTAGIKLVRYMAPNLPSFNGDPTQIHQILVNLVVNAIQAMPGGGTLTIRTAFDENRVYLSVQDTGTGMDEELLKQIFLPFFTTKDINSGTGLGLAVVDDIVTAHRGTIEVKSHKGEGTLFELSFPLKSDKHRRSKGAGI
jgi:two-component system NtrC family sensor kinase